MIDIFKLTDDDSKQCPLQLFQSITLTKISRDILDVQLITQNYGKIVCLFFKSGFIDFYEIIENRIDDEKQYSLIQSCRITLGQMNDTIY